jgi:Uma2 family endonuclease
MSTQSKTLLTEAEYLEIERRAESRSEYFRGEMFAMAGGSPTHGLIIANLIRELGVQLKKKPCVVYPSDVRLMVSPTGLYTYPDVMVVYGEGQFAGAAKDTLTNPIVIVEVLSPTTEGYDRGRKFDHYGTLPSLAEYLTVSQEEPHVHQFSRQPENRWLLTEFTRLDQEIALASVECVLPLAEIYHKVEWPSR